MILEAPKQLEVQRIGDLNEGITAGISEESLPFVFELVSKQLYSNPIGSLIREYTSNCFDSHVEAEVDEPVIISQTYDVEEGYAIEFKDVGVGLSPDRVQKIFMNYFSSTKRDSNLQIGGFGIGSKTALAYADMFYITTIFDGVKYEYLFHKGETKPTLESLHGYDEYMFTESIIKTDENTGEERIEQVEVLTRVPIGEPTEEHNGTTIKINIERGDLDKFREELKWQLAYFDNVYFKNWNIDNNYDIYEGEYYKFRSDMPQNDGSYYSRRGSEIHLCIGKVRYPIDTTKVSIPMEYENIPIAVKFEIGELQITPSRETIRYNPETIALIKDRIKLAANEIIEIFSQQNPVIEHLKEYVDLMNDKPKITFDKNKNHVLYLWSKSKVENSFRFKPLEGIKIKKTPKNLFFMWEKVAYITGSGIRIPKYSEEVTNKFILESNYIIATKDDRISTYTDLKLGTEDFPNGVWIIKRKPLDYDNISKSLNIKDTKDLGKAKTIKEYLTVINKIVIDRSEGKYSDLKAADEWIAAYKKSVKESSLAFIRKKNKKVFVRDAAQSFRGVDLSTDALERRTGILVYGYKEDQAILGKIWHTVVTNKQSIRKARDKHKAFMVIQVAKSSEKDIIPNIKFDKEGKRIASKTIYWKDFLKTKFFRKIETAYYISRELRGLDIDNIEIREKLLYKFKEDYRAVEDSHADYSYHRDFTVNAEYLSENYIQDMLIPLNKFKANHIFEIPRLISSLSSYGLYDELLKEAVEYLRFKKFKLKKEFYLKDARQLAYEHNLNIILRGIKNKTPQFLLTYTLNQQQNVNEERTNTETSNEESSIREEDINFDYC